MASQQQDTSGTLAKSSRPPRKPAAPLLDKAALNVLFARVESGLKVTELRQVARLVKHSDDTALQRRGLHILGWAKARQHTALIATFLARTDDLTLPAMALRALVVWFGSAAPYVETLKRFLRGIPEDVGQELQLVALESAGDAYRQTGDRELLSLIVPFVSSTDDILAGAAQDSLVAGLTPEWDTLAPRERDDRRRLYTDRYLDEACQILKQGAATP